MTGLLLLPVLAGAADAQAQALGVHAMTGAISTSPLGVRPGLRLSYEPAPSASIDLMGAAGLEPWAAHGLGPGWEAGLSLSGRLWFTEPRDGLFALGRVCSGVAGEPDGRLGPWMGTFVGFGGRIDSLVNIEAAVGPEWSAHAPQAWRTELSVGILFDSQSGRRKPTSKHRPRKPPR